MEVHLSPEQEERLEKIANERGIEASAVLTEMLARALEYENWFVREVEKGRASLRRGEFVDHDELKARIAKRFQRA
jgi:predicted transcriptional regulator